MRSTRAHRAGREREIHEPPAAVQASNAGIRFESRSCISSAHSAHEVCVMDFPSLDWMKALQSRCNESDEFCTASKWSDVKLVFDFGQSRYWLKLYKGRIIDVTDYGPNHPLGYDVILSAQPDVWQEIEAGRAGFWASVFTGAVRVDGNQVECNRMHEAISIMCIDLMPAVRASV